MEFEVEVDAQLYDAVSVIAKENGTTVEQMVEEFLRWCTAEETQDAATRQIEQWAKELKSKQC